MCRTDAHISEKNLIEIAQILFDKFVLDANSSHLKLGSYSTKLLRYRMKYVSTHNGNVPATADSTGKTIHLSSLKVTSNV